MKAEGRRVLLLDVDGVLVLPPEMFGARLMRLYPQEAQEFFHGPFLKASTGQAELLELLPPLLSAVGYAGTPEAFMQEWFAAENVPNLPLLEAVKELRGAGWPVYLATNQERHRLHYLLHDMGLGQFVDGEFASCTVGVRKPDAAYFERVQERLNLSPARIVFWDDAPANVQAARAAGWTSHLYENLAGFTREMARLALA
ncbi:HAD family phosphatase [Deinococcus radiomollis]|uniref:HAD family hydrolase n=1 Tax=Deinococcus radiomollis TaxID=468916 RepID=UPI003891F686